MINTRFTAKSGIIKRIFQTLGRNEKVTLSIAIIVLSLAIIGQVNNFAKYTNYTDKPSRGGELVEGTVASSAARVDVDITNLTNIGLLRFDKDGNITENAAQSYNISPDGKTYTYTLKDAIDPQTTANILKEPASDLGSAEISSDGNKIIIKLASPYAPILANSTRPILPYGPYLVGKRTQQEIMLSSNPNFIYGEPLIPTIIIKIYPSQDKLVNALKRKEIMAAYNVDGSFSGFNRYDLPLQKRTALFFNLDRAPWNNNDLRSKIAHNQPLNEAMTLFITTTSDDRLQTKLSQLKESYKALNINVEPNIVDNKDLKDNIIPKRNYDALLYGIDYGRDPDPYPFWHSSQVSENGNNLSNYKNKNVDMLLEQALMAVSKEERDKKYAAFQAIFDQEIPAILFERETSQYILTDKVKGVNIDYGITGSDRYYNVWEWYIRTQKVIN